MATPSNLYEYYHSQNKPLPTTAAERFADPAFAAAAKAAGYNDPNSYQVNMQNAGANSAILGHLLSGNTPAPAPVAPTAPIAPTTTPTQLPRVAPPDVAGPRSEEDIYKTLVGQSSGLIDAINKNANYALKQARAGNEGVLAAAGLGGSSAAYTSEKAQEDPILAKQQLDQQTVYKDIRDKALAQYNTETTANRENAVANIKALASAHVDWNKIKTEDPNGYNAIVKSVGGDPNVADAMFASSIPPANIQQSWVDGTKYSQLVTDPITGKPTVMSYDLGVKIPQSWTQEKIGTNSVLYHGSNWDPKDPSTFQIFAVDPLTGIPTNQIAGDTNSTMGDSTVASVADMLTQAGITVDPNAPIDPSNVDGIADALIQHENSQLDPELNNPGDIKFSASNPLPGETDSGIAASDGGTWAKFDTQDSGRSAVRQLVQTGAKSGKSFSDFVKSYTGTGPTGQSAAQKAIQSWVDNIKNGNATITNVPAAARTAVSNALAATDSTSYSPLAAARFSTAANRIVNNYIQMPAYQLTAGGQLYLGRINAAMKTPGSVSDQDLLDSLTKLNTGGNAISDAQVKLITDGQSYSDWAGALGNKFKNGGVLSDNQRNQIQTLAQNIFQSYKDAYKPIYQQATAQLQEAGIPKAFWTIPNLDTLSTDQNSSASSANSAPSSLPADIQSKLESSVTLGSDGKTMYIPRDVWSTFGANMDAVLAEAKADGYTLLVQ